MALNFKCFKDTNPKLYQYGTEMEENLFKDRAACAQCGSDFLDEFVKEIYSKEGMPYVYKSFFTKNIDELEQKGIISPKVRGLLEKAKLLRDYKFDKNYSRERAIALHGTLVELTAWFSNRYDKTAS